MNYIFVLQTVSGKELRNSASSGLALQTALVSSAFAVGASQHNGKDEI